MIMKTKEELIESLHEFTSGKRKTCFSEVESLLHDLTDYLNNAPTASADAAASAPYKKYQVTLTLEEDFLATSSEEAWEMAVDLISTRQGMKLCANDIKELPEY
jgi:hypothetical protein